MVNYRNPTFWIKVFVVVYGVFALYSLLSLNRIEDSSPIIAATQKVKQRVRNVQPTKITNDVSINDKTDSTTTPNPIEPTHIYIKREKQ